MVGGDGIEPPEPMATDLQSAPLPTTEYPPKLLWWRMWESNPRPLPCKGSALAN